MYIPKQFLVQERTELIRFMRENSFATIVSYDGDSLVATHLPFVIVEESDTVKLICHMALANSQWKNFENNREVLVIFQGPHAYISPSHYNDKLNVPTWNYAAVHAYGTPRILSGDESKLNVLKTSIQNFELEYMRQLDELPNDFISSKLKGIVAFEINVSRLEGKYKLSQNREFDEQEQIAESLSTQGDSVVASVGKMMKKSLEGTR